MGTGFTGDQLSAVLEEIAEYQIELEEDPTQPHLGNKYLQQKIAQCRGMINRVQYYLQKIGKYEKELRLKVKLGEMDIEFKINEKLADDPIVRQQSSINDRRALAISQLKQEHEDLAKLKIDLMDVQETLKLLKMKYGDLRSSNTDIKAQRQLVKDDVQAWGSGENGYTPPQARQDGTIPDGMPPPVTGKIDPQDVLNPDKRPEDLPEPRDAVHAQQIAEFFSSSPPKPKLKDTEDSTPAKTADITYDDLLKV